MQKKIMLALLISNGIIVCQAPEPEQPAAQTNEAAQPAQANATSTEMPVAAQPKTAEQPEAKTTETATPATEVAPVSQPIEQPKAAEAEQPTEAPVPIQAPQETAPEMQSTEQPKVVETETTQVPQEPEFKPQPQEPEEEEIEIKGIDTVDINEPKGNWLYKRIWWEKAERTYEKIKQLTDKILESRMNFFVKRNELDRQIVEFYSDLGFKQGELSELISFSMRQLEQERKTEGSLSEKEREFLELLTQEKNNIEQLQQGNQNILKIDRALEDALMKLVEQLNQAKYYEQQAWEHFKAINRELSDKKARELFYSMDTYWRNLNSINGYLSDAFAKYFDQLGEKLQEETDKIKTNAQALSEKGISLELQATAMKKECKIPAKEEAQPEEPEQPAGLLGSLWGWITAPFSAVSSGLGQIYESIAGLFGGSSSGELVLTKPVRKSAKETTQE
jgi:hypothetical protein